MSEPKYALITGAASGLGRALAVRLAKDGWHIALADIDEAGNRESLELVRAAGGQGQCESLDVTKSEQWQSLLTRLQSAWPRIDLLVNNAGVAAAGEVGQFSLDDWRWIVEINLFGTIYGCHTFVEWLKQNPRGSKIVNIASVAAIVSPPSMAAYNLTKAGILSLTETLYAELRPFGVGVLGVCPGFFATNLLSRGRFDTPRQQAMATHYMENSRCSADDVADKIVRLLPSKRLYLVFPARAYWLWRVKRWIPSAVLNMVSRNYHQSCRVTKLRK